MPAYENSRGSSPFDDPNRMGGVAGESLPDEAKEITEEQRLAQLHKKLLGWFEYEQDQQMDSRYQMSVDEDFYDGLQWSEEDANVLMQRGQAPLVFNKIKPAVNWLLGTEKRTRVDYKILPREADDEQAAEVKSKLLKYVSDVNRLPFERSKAFEDMVKVGVGWLEDGVTYEPGSELMYSRYESWRNMWRDSNGIEPDLKDSRYLFRAKWLDLDVAQMLFPEKHHLLSELVERADRVDEQDDWYLGSRVNIETIEADMSPLSKGIRQAIGDNQVRDRLRLIECWYREPVARKVCRGGRFNGDDFDEGLHADALACGDIQVIQHTGFKMRVAIFSDSDLFYDGESPYKHNEFPFTPIWGYMRKRDNTPYGVIRDIRDAQEDYNKRASKALFLLSVNRITMDKGAVDDVEELREEAARPDSIIEVNNGKDLRFDQDKQLANQHLQLMSMDGQMIQDISGITDENMGRSTNATSGKAITARQEQGAITTEPLFDNLRYAVQQQGEKQLSLLQQFYTERKVVRIVGENKPVEWLVLNDVDDHGQKINDITATKADFVVSERDYRDSLRQAMFESMLTLVSKLPPQVGMNLLDLVVDFVDVPNKSEIVERIRKMTGQRDPSKQATEEDMQAQQAQAQQQQLQQQLMMKKLEADVAEVASKAEKADADALLKRLQAMLAGQDIAANIVNTSQIDPGISNMADSVVKAADEHSVVKN